MSDASNTESPTAGASASAPSIPGYHAALDGFRGFGVLAVLLGHAGQHSGEYAFAKGAVFAISMFFGLSGYLITTLLLLQRDFLGKIDIWDFWSRRFRRLMPVAFLGILLAVAFVALVGDPTQKQNLQGDTVGSLAYVANWRFALSGAQYADQFASPSPLLHYWTLAIEEQFYLLYPLLLIFLFKVGRGSYLFIGSALGGLYLVSAATTLLLTRDVFDPNRVYFGTDTRAAELLMGSLVAVLVYRGKVPSGGRAKRNLVIAGTVAFVVELYVWFGIDPEQNLWAVRGGFPINIMLGMLIFIATVEPRTLLNRLLAFRPFVVAGQLSYGAYVFQWPIILWMSPRRMGVSVWALLPVYVILVFGLAYLADRYVERPIRRRKVFTPPQAWAAMGASMLVLAAMASVVTARAPDRLLDLDRSEQEAERLQGELGGGDGIRVAFFGDSTAQTQGVGAFAWMADNTEFVPAGVTSAYGCGVTGATDFLDFGGYTRREECANWLDHWSAAVESYQPQIAVVSIVTDVAGKKIPGTDGFTEPGDPEHDQAVLDGMLQGVDLLHEAGAHVVWLRNPQILVEHPDHRPRRMDRLNQLIDEVAVLRPGVVSVVDLGAWVQAQDDGERNRSLRPDLVHFTASASVRVTEEVLAPALVDIARNELG